MTVDLTNVLTNMKKQFYTIALSHIVTDFTEHLAWISQIIPFEKIKVNGQKIMHW